MPIPFNNMASSFQVLENSRDDSLLELDKDQSELQDFGSKMEISQTHHQSRNKSKNLKSATEMHKAVPYDENLVGENNMTSERLLTN